MKRKDNTLTKVEFEVMNILWDIDEAACAWDVLEHYKEPKPAYTTIATYLKVLYEKGYLDFHKVDGQGKTHRYVPLVTRAEYTRRTMQEVKQNFFGGSVKSMLSYFVSEENLSAEEVKELLELVQPLSNP
ncbi:MAG: BlaI/MecI/CopY family transcriptional regulator [Bacteroidaceae bacterium]|nr:BlaI/MecI/CopY family transcriptional regulator [Bacteroidaceae bacterium]